MSLNMEMDTSVSREDLFRRALQLDQSERAAPAGMLIDCIDSDGEEKVEAAWMASASTQVDERELRFLGLLGRCAA